jgi:hypothetical protein
MRTILGWLFRSTNGKAQAAIRLVDEDYGYNDHMVGQKRGPFYCGTAFCGHSTKQAARACWKKKCDAIDAINAEEKALLLAGKKEQAERVSRKRDA